MKVLKYKNYFDFKIANAYNKITFTIFVTVCYFDFQYNYPINKCRYIPHRNICVDNLSANTIY